MIREVTFKLPQYSAEMKKYYQFHHFEMYMKDHLYDENNVIGIQRNEIEDDVQYVLFLKSVEATD